MALWILLLAFAPGLFWLWYVYQKDRGEPEPRHLILKAFLWGLAIAFPAALLELAFIWSEFLLIVIGAPLIEECLKYLVVRRTVYNREEFSEPVDGIVYSAAVALGFASIENFVYLLSAQQEDLLAPVFLGRAIFSVPGHVLFSTIWGAALGRAKFVTDPVNQAALIRTGLLTAIVAHGLFNFLALSELWGAIGLLVFTYLAWKFFHRRVEETLAESPYVRRWGRFLGQRDRESRP